MPAIILAFFTTTIIVELTMAALGSRSWTGFVVKNSHVDSQEFNRKRARGARLMEQPFGIANGEIRCRLRGTARRSSPRREADDDDGPGGSQRSHDVHLLGPSARMHIEWSGPRFSAGAKRDDCLKADNGRKHVGFNTTGHLGRSRQREIMALMRAERAGTTFAN
ncbi:FixH family protein [Mesorhizobium sp. M0016]|uniref:FixH family protein n=1 Tax=Mesorhizobium sp. M0016 TaxID=2956843 RepID=UPI00333B2909